MAYEGVKIRELVDRAVATVGEVNLWGQVLDFDISVFSSVYHVFRRNDFSFGRK